MPLAISDKPAIVSAALLQAIPHCFYSCVQPLDMMKWHTDRTLQTHSPDGSVSWLSTKFVSWQQIEIVFLIPYQNKP